MLRFLTAGESHGQALVAILEGMPAGLAVDLDAVTIDLRRRQTGYGRGRRMQIESDRAQPLSGVRHGHTTGGPIALLIPNKDWDNWQRTMYVESEMPGAATGTERPAVTRPRPGHADLAGVRQVWTRGHAQRPRARERAGNGGARRRRRHRAPAAADGRRRDREPRHGDWVRCAAGSDWR